MLLNRFLDAPIVIGKRDAAVKRIKAAMRGERASGPGSLAVNVAASVCREHGVTSHTTFPFTPGMYPMLTQCPAPVNADVERHVREGVARLQARAKRAEPTCPTIEIPDEYFEEMSRAALFTTLIDRLQASPNRAAPFLSAKATSWFSAVFVTMNWVIFIKDGEAWVAAYEHLLAAKDCALQRANCYFSSQACLTDMKLVIKKVMLWQELCWASLDNEGADILKGIEPLAKAMLTEKTCQVFSGPGGTYDLQLSALRRKEMLLRNRGRSPLVDRLDKLLRELTLEECIEAFGLLRISGHPDIDPQLGGRSASQEARTPDLTSPQYAKRLWYSWRRMYVSGYIKKYKRWPPMQFEGDDRTTSLYTAYSRDDLHVGRKSFPLEDWGKFRFYQAHEFDYFPDYLDLQDDKSLSYMRSDKAASWDRNVKPKSHRRLFLELITQESFNIQGIFERIQREGIPLEWRIVSLYPKEREFKRKARMFAMLTLEMRTVLNCLEANVADKIMPCFPEQTMTLPRDDILKRFLGKSSGEPLSRLYVEIDFSRWNLRWREEVHRRVAQDLDDIFGVEEHFTIPHRFFSSSVIMVRHPDYRPTGVERSNSPESDLLWYNHLGGFEGLAQKVWSIMTYAFCDLAMDEFDLPYSLIGQGDNQVFVVDIRSLHGDKQHIAQLGRALAEGVSVEADRVGQSVKPEECLYSTTVITYSKDIFVNGSLRFAVLKAHSRIFCRAVEDMPSVASRVSGCFSSAEGAAAKSYSPMVSFFIAASAVLYEFFVAARQKAWWTELSGVKDDTFTRSDVMADIMWAPTCLGGIAQSLSQFLYRGSADNATKELALSSKYREDPWYKYALAIINADMPADPDPTLLLESPTALPVPRGASLAAFIKREMIDSARLLTKNRDLKPLLAPNLGSEEKKFIDSIISISPLNPYMAHDIYATSVFGVRDEIFTLVSCSRTAVALRATALIEEEDEKPDISLLTVKHEGFPFIHLRSILERMARYTAVGTDLYTTGYSLTRKLRSLFPVELQGVTACSPLDYERILTSQNPAIGVRVPAGASKTCKTSLGVYAPLFGMKTSARRSTYGYRIVATGKGERAVASLAFLLEAFANTEVKDIVKASLSSRTSIDVEEFSGKLWKQVGGTSAHRYLSSLRDRGATAQSGENYATHVIPDSNQCGVLAGGESDYPIMFQEFFSLALARLVSDTTTVRVREAVYAPQDLHAIDESKEPTATRRPPDLSRIVDTPLVRVSQVALISSAGSSDIPGVIDGIESFSLVSLLSSALIRRVTYDFAAATASTRSSLGLDFAEMMRVTVARFVQAAAHASLMLTAPLILARGDPSLGSIVDALREVVYETCKSWLQDPALAPNVAKQLAGLHIAHASTRYGERNSRALETLTSLTLRSAESQLLSTKMIVPYIYLDDEDTELSKVLTGSVALAVLKAAYVDPRAAVLARRSYSYTVRALRSVTHRSGAEAGRETVFALANILEIASRENCESLRASAGDLVKRGIARRILLPRAVGIRHIRSHPIPPLVDSLIPNTPIGRMTVVTPSPRTVSGSRLRRRGYALGGSGYAAHGAWARYDNLLPASTATVIGVGEGSVVVSLINQGVPYVVGVDLATDLATATLTSNDVVPSLVVVNGCKSRFSYHKSQFELGTAWPMEDLVSSLAADITADSAIILDYSPSVETLIQDINAAYRGLPGHVAYKRVLISTPRDRRVLAGLRSDNRFSISTVYVDQWLEEVIVRFRCSFTIGVLPVRPETKPHGETTVAVASLPSSLSEYEVMCSLAGLQYPPSLESAYEALERVARGKRIRFDLYSQLLHVVVLEMARTHPHPFDFLGSVFVESFNVRGVQCTMIDNERNRFTMHHIGPKILVSMYAGLC